VAQTSVCDLMPTNHRLKSVPQKIKMATRKSATSGFRAGVVDKYLAAVPEEKRALLEKLRQTITAVVPDAEEILWYQMPTFKFEGRPLVSFGAYQNHCSLFPLSGAIIKAHEDDLKSFVTSKGTIRFTSDKPLPAALVKKIVRARIKQNRARAKKALR
jgi:uncharacterized protein YdhG (YjbR/CyaY superfamily)